MDFGSHNPKNLCAMGARLDQRVIDMAVSQSPNDACSLRARVEAKGGQFEHRLLVSIACRTRILVHMTTLNIYWTSLSITITVNVVRKCDRANFCKTRLDKN